MKTLALISTLLLAPLSLSALASSEISPYEKLGTSVRTSTPEQIEVIEFFGYGCPACYTFESSIRPWADKLPPDVRFLRVPALFGGPWDLHGQLFLTLQAMGVEDELRATVFLAAQQNRKSLSSRESMADALSQHGLDKQKFLQTFDSFAVKGQMAKYRQLAESYRLTSVPTLIVNGKYRFDLRTAGGAEGALRVADQLIARERLTPES